MHGSVSDLDAKTMCWIACLATIDTFMRMDYPLWNKVDPNTDCLSIRFQRDRQLHASKEDPIFSTSSATFQLSAVEISTLQKLPLKFSVFIADICRQKDDQGRHVLSIVEDKVVQDVDGTEGTGIWSQLEAVRLHVPAPSLTTAHFIRLASAFRADCKQVKDAFSGQFPVREWSEAEGDKKSILESLRRAIYATFLASLVEGINIIDQADQENRWNIDYSAVVQIWRNGCIIKADYITNMLADIFKEPKVDLDLLHNKSVAQELKQAFPALKEIVVKGVEHNAIIPSLSATGLFWETHVRSHVGRHGETGDGQTSF